MVTVFHPLPNCLSAISVGAIANVRSWELAIACRRRQRGANKGLLLGRGRVAGSKCDRQSIRLAFVELVSQVPQTGYQYCLTVNQ